MKTIPSRLGPFALEEPLEQSSGCKTFHAVHIQRRVQLAIRLLTPKSIQTEADAIQFAERLKPIAALNHPNIGRCLGAGTADGWSYVVYAYVAGESLAENLERLGKRTWESAIEVLQPICKALDFAEQKGIAHGRLHPRKIMLEESGEVKLLGFASSEIAMVERGTIEPLMASEAIYLAPEQLSSKGKANSTWDHRCDQYAVGVLLFQMLTGKLPFPISSLQELLAARNNSAAPRVNSLEMDCPVWLDVLVEKLLSNDPSKRFSSMQKLLTALDEVQRNLASGVGTAQRALSKKREALVRADHIEELQKIRRKKTIKKKNSQPFFQRAWFLAVLLLLIIGGSTWALWPASEETLFQQAKTLMQSSETNDWYKAEEKFLLPLQKRFPNGSHAKEVIGYLEKIERERAMKQFLLHRKLGSNSSCEGEHLFSRAWDYEHFGDRTTAIERYESLVDVFKDNTNKKNAPFVSLAKERTKILREKRGAAEPNLAEFIRSKLAEAHTLSAQGDTKRAKRIWGQIVQLYFGNPKLKNELQEAKDRLTAMEAVE